MILHLVSDHLVTNSCLKVFRENLPGQNVVLMFKRFGYQVDADYIVTHNNASKIAKTIDFSQVTYVIVSFLTRKKIHFIKNYVPENIPVIWWSYGADLYFSFLTIRGFNVSFSDPDRYRYLGRLTLPFVKFSKFLSGFYFRYLQDKYVVSRLAGFIPCIQPDYDMLRKYVKKDFASIRIHPYGASLKFEGRFAEGNDVALGHAGSISDNHLYALNYLKGLDLGDSELYLTLSYSNTVPKYTNEVKREFKKVYGEKVHMIEEMMPKDEYFQSQFRFKAMILSSWRQEALDNIYTCLQIGIRLILSEKGILYKYLRDYGFKVFSLEMLTQEEFNAPLPLQDRIHNQQLFEQFVQERKRNYYDDFRRFFLKND